MGRWYGSGLEVRKMGDVQVCLGRSKRDIRFEMFIRPSGGDGK